MNVETVNAAITFAESYLDAEFEFEKLAHSAPDDQDFWKAQHAFKDRWYTPEVHYHSSAPRHRPAKLPEKLAERTRRPLFRVEAHRNDTHGTLFSMQIGDPRQNRRGQHRFDEFLQFAEVEGGTRIVSKWTCCMFCYAGGLGRDDATCAECKGRGWLHPSDEVFGPTLPLGPMLFSKRIEETTHRRSQNANDKPEQLPSDGDLPATRSEIDEARAKAEVASSHSDPFRTFAKSVLLPPTSRAAMESYDLGALARVENSTEREACELMLLEKLRARDDDPRLVAALLALGTESARQAMEEALREYAESTATHRALAEALANAPKA